MDLNECLLLYMTHSCPVPETPHHGVPCPQCRPITAETQAYMREKAERERREGMQWVSGLELERLRAIEQRAADAARGNASETDEYERGWLDACGKILRGGDA